MHRDNEWYWATIPVGKAHAVSYGGLQAMWGMNEREVRKTLAALSDFDNGDNYILIRSSKGAGFYRTDDPEDIESYKRECRGRALSTLAPLKKINRVLRAANAESINCSVFNNLQLLRRERGLSQAELCMHMRKHGCTIDMSLLSKIENGYVLPTPAQLSALAFIFNCEPCEVVAMGFDSLDVYRAHSGLQVPLF